MPKLLSVNVGSPQVLPGSATPTGIVKLPRTGPVLIDEMGVLGDAVLDKVHHGGRDQAVHRRCHHRNRKGTEQCERQREKNHGFRAGAGIECMDAKVS